MPDQRLSQSDIWWLRNHISGPIIQEASTALGAALGKQWRLQEGPYPSSVSSTCLLVQFRQGTEWTTLCAITPQGTILNQAVGGNAWTAPLLSPPWANVGGGLAAAGYYRDPSSIVHVRGVVGTGATTVNAGSQLFTLPAGYRPAATMVLPLLVFLGAAPYTLYSLAFQVATSGILSIYSVSAPGQVFPQAIPLCSIEFSFRAEQ